MSALVSHQLRTTDQETDRQRRTERNTVRRRQEASDEDEAGVWARITLTRLDVATDQLPLAVTATYIDGVPGRLAPIHSVTGTPTTSSGPGRRLQGGELLALDTYHGAGDQSTSPVVTSTGWPSLNHREFSAVTVSTKNTRTFHHTDNWP